MATFPSFPARSNQSLFSFQKSPSDIELIFKQADTAPPASTLQKPSILTTTTIRKTDVVQKTSSNNLNNLERELILKHADTVPLPLTLKRPTVLKRATVKKTDTEQDGPLCKRKKYEAQPSFIITKPLPLPKETMEVLRQFPPLSGYSFIELLSKSYGTFSKIYVAKHRATGETCAAKIIVHYKKSAIAERRILEKIKGIPYVLQIRGSGRIGNRPVIITDLIQVENLYFTKASLPFEQIMIITKQALQALESLDKEKIVHGDLKPENMVFKKNLTILDFGFSFEAGEYQKTKDSLLQTQYYRSPECILGGTSGSMDMWSLGCIIYELVVHFPLFHVPKSEEFTYCVTDSLQDDCGHVQGSKLNTCTHNDHLSLIVDQIGPPSLKWVATQKNGARFFKLDNNKQPELRLPRLLSRSQPWMNNMIIAGELNDFPRQPMRLLTDLVYRMLQYEEKRTTPAKALMHDLFKESSTEECL